MNDYCKKKMYAVKTIDEITIVVIHGEKHFVIM